MFRMGFFQFNPLFGKVSNNLAHVLKGLAGVDADLVVLPELAFTGYYFRDRAELRELAEDPLDSRTVESLTSFCADHRLHLITGFAEKAADRIFNSALLIGPAGVVHIYRKIHLFNTETDYFDPGDTPLAVVTVSGVRVGIMICFDWVFPETARILALQGAEIICHPANLVLDLCHDAMITRSIENNVFTITANRYGSDLRPHGTFSFTGKSQITNPKGERLGRAEAEGDRLCIVEVDPAQASEKWITPKNHLLNDRRPDFYTSLTAR